VKIAYSSEPAPTTCHQRTNNEKNILFIEQSGVLIQEISPENTNYVLIQEISPENTNYAGSNRENLFFYDVNTHSRKIIPDVKAVSNI